jgi:lipopolysaccharide transport system permease protein
MQANSSPIHAKESQILNPLTIEPGRQERNYWRDLWQYRELLCVLDWWDLAVRYKQKAIGVAWALIRPLATIIVFTIIFARIAKFPSDGSAPYPLMAFAGMLPWKFSATGLSKASNSRVNNANLISKVYFPRLMCRRMAWYRFLPARQILRCRPLALAFVTAMGADCESPRATSNTGISGT